MLHLYHETAVGEEVAKGVLPKTAVKKLENTYRKGRVRLVSARYRNPAKNLKVIAVTGTNGKTTTLNFINEILKEAGYKTAMFTTAVIEVAGDRKINDVTPRLPQLPKCSVFP